MTRHGQQASRHAWQRAAGLQQRRSRPAAQAAAHQAGHNDVDLEGVAADPRGEQVVLEAAQGRNGLGQARAGLPAMAGTAGPASPARTPPRLLHIHMHHSRAGPTRAPHSHSRPAPEAKGGRAGSQHDPGGKDVGRPHQDQSPDDQPLQHVQHGGVSCGGQRRGGHRIGHKVNLHSSVRQVARAAGSTQSAGRVGGAHTQQPQPPAGPQASARASRRPAPPLAQHRRPMPPTHRAQDQQHQCSDVQS